MAEGVLEPRLLWRRHVRVLPVGHIPVPGYAVAGLSAFSCLLAGQRRGLQEDCK